MARLTTSLLCALFVLAASTRVARAQSVTVIMTADKTQVGVGETLTVEVRADVTGAEIESFEPPDLSAFSIVGQRIANPMSFRFGFGNKTTVMQATTVRTYTLLARRAGRLELGAARVTAGGRQFTSNPLTIVVTAGGGAGLPPGQPQPPAQLTPMQPLDPFGQAPRPAPQSATPPIGVLDGAEYDPQAFLRTVVDQSEPWVGQQVTVTIYLYARGGLRSSPTMTREATADEFWVHDLLPATRSLDATQQIVGGQPFQVYVLRRFAAFALRDGALTIGAPEVTVATGSVFDLFAQAGASLERRGVPATVHAKPLPDAGRPSGTVYVGRFQVDAHLDRTQVATGDAVTFTATVRGSGNVREVRLAAPVTDGLRVLTPQIREEVSSPGDLVGGVRTFEWLIVPERAGTYLLPPIVVAYFDPATASYARTASGELSLVAAGNAQTVPAEPAAAAGGERGARSGDMGDVAQLAPVRTTSELRRTSAVISSAAWYPWALAVPPAMWFGWLLVALARRRLGARAQAAAAGQVVRQARKQLSEAAAHAARGDPRAFYGAVAQALRAVIEARLGAPIGGFIHNELRAHLIARGMQDDLASRIIDELEGFDFARFSAAGVSQNEMADCLERTRALLNRANKFRPMPGDAQ